MSADLPAGWASARLDQLLTPGGLFDGPFGSSLKTADYVGSGVRVIRLENIGNLRFVADKRTFISHRKFASLKKHQVSQGDIIFGSFVDSDVRVCLIPALDTVAIAKADCFCIRPLDAVADRRFVTYFLSTRAVRDCLAEHIHGATRPRITTRQLREVEIHVPPIEEQRRIAAKLEAVLDRVNACQRRLEKIPAILKRFRQSVLVAATSGRLTDGWRKNNVDGESARQAIKAINALRGGSAHPPVGATPCAPLPDTLLPETWEWVRFGDVIGELRNGLSPRPNVDPPGIPILRISAARPGCVDLTDIRYLQNGKEFVPVSCVKDGDLLFTRYNGSLELLGVCGMVRGVRNSILYPDKLMRVRFDHPYVLPGYAEIYFQSPDVHDWVIAKSKSSAGQNGVSGSDIKSQPFAMPPVREQREIVRRVEALFAYSERLMARFERTKAAVGSLTQSILAKAFRGELVPTEAELAELEGRSFESAEELLARITAKEGPAKRERAAGPRKK